MTFPQKTTEVQEKRAEQVAGQSDSVLGSQAITKPEDNRIFLADKSQSAGVKSLDFSTADIYQARPESNNVKSDRAVIDEYIVKPGDSPARIAKQLAGKDGTPRET
jgi:hypothetical protein